MKKVSKRLLAWTLSILTIFSTMGMTAFAETNPQAADTKYSHGTIAVSAEVGGTTVADESNVTMNVGDTMNITVSPYVHVQYAGCGMPECPAACESMPGMEGMCFTPGKGCEIGRAHV